MKKIEKKMSYIRKNQRKKTISYISSVKFDIVGFE